MTNLKLALQAGKEFLDQEDYEAAFRTLIPCAEAGIVEAEAEVGLLYMLGLGTHRDLRKAVIFLKRAVDNGSGVAAHNLGTLYITCEPEMPLNPEESQRWFSIAADMGFLPGEPTKK
jgi:hypothetical protein